MRGMLFYAHSGLRYLVLVAALVAIGYLAVAIMQRKPFDKGSRLVAAIYTGLLDLQTLLGLMTLITVPFYGALLGHVFTMFAAVLVAHGAVISTKRKPADEQSNTPVLLGIVVSVALIVLGILSIGRPIFGSS